MSWMDSWSRPSKHSAVPPPLYLTAGESVPYCLTCGRVMSTKKASKKTNNEVKYCSDRCRSRKPGKLDKKIEQAIVALLDQEKDSGLEKTGAKDRFVKGDHRIVVTCDEIEEIVFGSRFDPEKVYGRRKNRKSRAIGGSNADAEWKTVDMESSEDSASDDAPHEPVNTMNGPIIRPPQAESDVNFSVGAKGGKLRERRSPLRTYRRKLMAKNKRKKERWFGGQLGGLLFLGLSLSSLLKQIHLKPLRAQSTKGRQAGRRML
ncbi:hypothetical protein H4I95_00838 [Botrytis cinerea]